VKTLCKSHLLLCSALFFATVQCRAETEAQWPEWGRGDGCYVNVKVIQHLLRYHGYQLKVDGKFGRETERKLKQFQTHRRLSVNGKTTAPTWRKLIVRILHGSRGDAVRAAQLQLRLLGYKIPVDGVFGKQTSHAVRIFQKNQEQTIDGIVGPRTWNHLILATAVYYEDGCD
jgi:peptidoglycan hydrolase-like protein with peptidoglycan-binding domain